MYTKIRTAIRTVCAKYTEDEKWLGTLKECPSEDMIYKMLVEHMVYSGDLLVLLNMEHNSLLLFTFRARLDGKVPMASGRARTAG